MSGLGLLEITAGVRRLLEVCVAVHCDERVLIVTDTSFDDTLVAAFALIAKEMGAEPVIVTMERRRVPGAEPPGPVAAAMKAADVILELTSQFIGSSRARVDACQAGARYLVLAQLHRANLVEGGAVWADFDGIKPLAHRLGELFSRAKRIRFVTPAGTDLTASIDGRRGRPLVGLAREKGGYAAPPDIEVGVSPVEDSANGTVVVDGALLLMADGVLREPVRILVKDGKAVSIEGQEAYALREMIRRCGDDPRMFNLAEMSIGLNPLGRVSGLALESEAALGTGHIALGNNVAYGGYVDAPGHLDCVLRDVSVYLDGELIADRGRFVGEGVPS
jgi:leucyl aminopeptidase (aminopeptidase T)